MIDDKGSAEPAQPDGPPPVPLWRNRDYNLWWSGAAVSQLGGELTALAYPLLILAETGSAAQAGVVATCQGIGFLAGSVPAGVLADRLPRRALIVVSALVEAVVVGTMLAALLTGHVWLVQIGAVALIQGAAQAIGGAAHMPVLRRIVPESQIKIAFARDHARDMGAQLAGPPLGGVLYSVARWLPFLGDVISFAAVAAAGLLMRTPLGPDRKRPGGADSPDGTDGDAGAAPRAGALATFRRDFAEGFAVLWGSAFLRYTMIWCALVNAAIGGLALLFVVTLRTHGASPSTIGATESLVAGLGLAGALATGWIVTRMTGYRILLVVSWLLVASTVGVALLAQWYWAAGAAFGLTVFFVTPLNVTLLGHVMKSVPDELTGRVTAAITMVAQSLKWLVPIAVGAAADAFTPTVPILGLAVVFAALAGVNHLIRSLREID